MLLPPGNCTPPIFPQYQYLPYDVAKPYFDIATFYGFANYFFQSNQGPSFPAHQFLLSGTSTPVLPGQHYSDWFAAENQFGSSTTGCIAPSNVTVSGIDTNGKEHTSWYVPPTQWNSGLPCYEHATLTDLLDNHHPQISWKYYAPYQGSLWTAPNAIEHMCVPDHPGGNCTNPDNWGTGKHVDLEGPITTLSPVLGDIQNCALPAVSWVVPDGQWSDHAGIPNNNGNSGLGPAYVAAIVNAIGLSYTKSNKRCDYWGYGTGSTNPEPTLILITWDDWGGWYDHVVPPAPRNKYEVGFRVPLLVVSAYTQGYVSCTQGIQSCIYKMDFGSILNFVEGNFGLPKIGNSTYADAQAPFLDPGFFNSSGRSFTPIPLPAIYSGMDASYFLSLPATSVQDPDDDATEEQP